MSFPSPSSSNSSSFLFLFLLLLLLLLFIFPFLLLLLLLRLFLHPFLLFVFFFCLFILFFYSYSCPSAPTPHSPHPSSSPHFSSSSSSSSSLIAKRSMAFPLASCLISPQPVFDSRRAYEEVASDLLLGAGFRRLQQIHPPLSTVTIWPTYDRKVTIIDIRNPSYSHHSDPRVQRNLSH